MSEGVVNVDRVGRLIYGTTGSLDIDDRTLAHLRIVIADKLRRQESFMFDVELDDGTGRRSFWMDPSVPIMFQPFTTHPVRINRAWLVELMHSASSAHGMRIVPEPVPAQSQAPLPVEG
jgi:hypothetical protein